MGEARRRGNREQRIAQAVHRHQEIEARQNFARQEARRVEEERIRNLPPEIRKEVMFRRASPKHRAAMLMGIAASGLLALPTIPEEKSRGR